MKWYWHVVFSGPTVVAALTFLVPFMLGCAEYESHTSESCAAANALLGRDLYWAFTLSALVVLPVALITTPLAVVVYALRAVDALSRLRSIAKSVQQ
jgi:hypothetical protein